MVDKGDLMRSGPTERVRKTIADARMKEFRQEAMFKTLPDKAELEAAAEGREKCKKCGGETRALICEVQQYNGGAADLEILLELNCRDSECKWIARTWRPWRKSAPLDF